MILRIIQLIDQFPQYDIRGELHQNVEIISKRRISNANLDNQFHFNC